MAVASALRPDVDTAIADNAVSIRHFTRRFGESTVLRNLNLDIAPGEFVALLGHSGSGKSTLLRALAGLDPVDEGQIQRPKNVSVVFQEHRLLPWKSVRDNVTLGLDGKEWDQQAGTILQEVGLGHRTEAWPLTLSGGEAQRAALARALIREPQLLMLDEPFAALDALTRLRMQKLVLDLWKKHNCAVLLVTHDVDEALALADRALVLERGEIRTEVEIPMARPRRHADPAFEALRERLLGALGVSV
ncbi:ABC transporter ATP-binding protein [Asaia astilbis]|uniref:ABC transporter ATP-binding protein n=1 Tax=Asaia astilbis TaxID=610244 RepID=UPI0004700C3F|nr:ABC transporter ATP-binding protein [Asaia astilbis]